MDHDPWLPMGHRLPDLSRAGRVIAAGAGWQILQTSKGLGLLTTLAAGWQAQGLVRPGQFLPLTFGALALDLLPAREGQVLAPVSMPATRAGKAEALAFARALAETRRLLPDAPLGGAIYAEPLGRLLPVAGGSAVADAVLLGAWVTGGLAIPATDEAALVRALPWADAAEAGQLTRAAGLKVRAPFALPGRPALEAFFNDHVTGLYDHPERWRALGLGTPPAVLLHGPRGSGKSFAVDRLIAHLGLPAFLLDPVTRPGPVLQAALAAAPSVLVLDEAEMLPPEAAGILDRLPEICGRGVLVLALARRIDPALHRARFDHLIELDYPGPAEVQALMQALLAKLPQEPDLQAAPLTRALAEALAGRPLSQVAHVVREAARLTARAGRDRIGQESLLAALGQFGRQDEGATRPARLH